MKSAVDVGPVRQVVHVVVLLASFGLTAVAASKLLPRDPEKVTLWFIGAVVAHDLVLLPVYSLLDRPLRALAERRRRLPVPWINHVRVPVVLSGLLMLVWFPLILNFPPRYDGITGTATDPYLGRWLAVTVVFVVASGAVYATRLLVARRR